MLPTERALCNKMTSDFNSLLGPVDLGLSQAKETARNLKHTLMNMVFSPDIEDVQNGVTSMKTSAGNLYPGDSVDDMKAMKNILDNCSYLNQLSPISNILGCITGVFDKIDNLIQSIGIPEFGAARLGSLLNDMFGGIGIPGGNNMGGSLSQADELIECVSLICAAKDPEYISIASNYTDQTNSLYDQTGIVSDPLSINYGKFDYEQMFNDIALPYENQQKFTTALNGVIDVKTGAIDAITKSVAEVKKLTKSGFF